LTSLAASTSLWSKCYCSNPPLLCLVAFGGRRRRSLLNKTFANPKWNLQQPSLRQQGTLPVFLSPSPPPSLANQRPPLDPTSPNRPCKHAPHNPLK
jgi:hypothetical protein